MNQFILGLTFFVPLTLGLFLLRLASGLDSAWRTDRPQQTVLIVKYASKFLWIAGAGFILVVFAALGMVAIEESVAPGNPLLLLAPVAVCSALRELIKPPLGPALLFLLVGCLGFPLLWLGGVLHVLIPSLARREPDGDGRALQSLRGLGCLLMAGACCLVLPESLLFLAPLPFIDLFLIRTSFRQLQRQRELLSLLTSTLQNAQPLGSELQAFALTQSGAYRQRLLRLVRNLQSGRPLSESLAQDPTLLPARTMDLFTVSLYAPSRAASLRDRALLLDARLAESTGFGFRLGDIVRRWLWTTLIVLSILSFLMFYIIPKYKAIFEGFMMTLPPVTISLIEFSDLVLWLPDFVIEYRVFLPLVLAIVIFVYVRWLRHSKLSLGYWLKYSWQRWFWPRSRTPDLLDQLAFVTEAAIPLTNGLRGLAPLRSNAPIRKRLERTAARVEQGASPWQTLANQRLIQRSQARFLEAAERAGNVSWGLHTLAEQLNQRRWYRAMRRMTCVDIVLQLLMGVCVAWVVLAMFTPLVSIINDLS